MQDINSNINGDRTDQQQQHHHQGNLFVNDLMDQMTHKFQNMSKSILDRIDGMGDRIESLEQSIDGLMETQGIERIDSSPSSTTQGIEEESSSN